MTLPLVLERGNRAGPPLRQACNPLTPVGCMRERSISRARFAHVSHELPLPSFLLLLLFVPFSRSWKRETCLFLRFLVARVLMVVLPRLRHQARPFLPFLLFATLICYSAAKAAAKKRRA